MTREIRLKDLVTIIPGDITVGIIKRKNGKEIVFHDISELSAQYACDYVECFDIAYNYFDEKGLLVRLVNA